jgi:hypothetical protein
MFEMQHKQDNYAWILRKYSFHVTIEKLQIPVLSFEVQSSLTNELDPDELTDPQGIYCSPLKIIVAEERLIRRDVWLLSAFIHMCN